MMCPRCKHLILSPIEHEFCEFSVVAVKPYKAPVKQGKILHDIAPITARPAISTSFRHNDGHEGSPSYENIMKQAEAI